MRYIINLHEQTLMSMSKFDFQQRIYENSSVRDGIKYDLRTLSERISKLSERIDDGQKFIRVCKEKEKTFTLITCKILKMMIMIVMVIIDLSIG